MIPISIDISDVIQEFTLSKDEVDSLRLYILDRVATEFTMRWEDQINNNLKSTRAEYKRGIFSESDEKNVTIGLTPRQSPMALMLEDGASSFDMKEGFKGSKNIKQGKNGWYLTIPFRFATSEALGESAIFSGKLPKPIENIVKVTKEPLKLNQIPGKFQGLGQNQTSGYKHKFNIYEGLQRIEIGSGKEKRGAYMNFRRVGEKSDPSAWIHPGFESLDLMGKALQETDIGAVVDDAINEFLKQ